MANESSNFINRRKFVRANIHATAHYVHSLHGGSVEIQTRISDISEGGALLVTFADNLPPGTLLKMNFVIPGSHFVSVGGKVKYTRSLEKDVCQSGIEFLRLEKHIQLAIRDYVATHMKK
jgi:c-di-GMP-binding flagellar brake protein YcgR